MSSRQDEAGPSGLDHNDILQLLGLEMSEEEEETPSDLLCQDEEDDLCQEVLDRFERQRAFQTNLLQQSGGGLDASVGTFDFELQPYVDRLSSRVGVRERHFNTRLRQRGDFIQDQNITQTLQDGLSRAVNQVLATTPNLHDQDRLYFTLGSDRLHNNFQGWGLRAGEWREGGERMDALFDRLAQALNSNEQFEMDDSFQLSITQVHHAPQGTGRRRQNKPGHATLQTITKNSRSVIRIQNDDDLCCARALVTAKARLDQHPKYHSIRHGTKLQKELALLLHHEAKVPLGPCSYDALTAFSAAPSLANYQIILVDAHRSFHITTKAITMSLLVYQGFSGPLMYVPTFGNHMTTKITIDATRKSNAGPVAKKNALISWRLTQEASKPHDVATLVIVTFSETLVSKRISSRTTRANQPPTLSPSCAFIAVAVQHVASRR